METPREAPPDEITQIRTVINQFLQDRLQPKLDKLKEDDEEKRRKLQEDHRPENWIADAARRTRKIQQVTHAIKYSHPDAKGTNIFSLGNPSAGNTMIGTHTLQASIEPDTAFYGGAADMPAFEFLSLQVNGKSIIERAAMGDPALINALPGDPKQKGLWIEAFAGLTAPKSQLSSHKLAKQIYWPITDDDYHLLAPLFPSSLAHHLWQLLREDRFSEAAKAAREAYRENQPHQQGFREYPDMAIVNFGGTKPQNISQLNSERHGEAWLLASVPPTWRSRPAQPPWQVESIFDRWFEQHSEVRRYTRELRRFLSKLGDRNNLEIRDQRAGLTRMIVDELLQFAAEIQDLQAGWSADPACKLNPEERYWLDPYRTGLDPEFATARNSIDWKEQVSHRFGNWLNARLRTDRTSMSDVEHGEWKTLLEQEMRLLREELDSHA